MGKILLLEFCLIVILLSNSGCAGLNDFYISKASNLGPNCKDWANGDVIVELSNLRLALRLGNHFLHQGGGVLLVPIREERIEINEKYRNEGSFEIQLMMKAYNNDFEFNPKEVYLKLEEGEYRQATLYYKPDYELAAPNPNFGPSYPWVVSKPESLTDFSRYFELPKHQWAGFRIHFDAPIPNPGTQFTIVIRGLKNAGRTLEPEEVVFKDKKLFTEVIN